MSSIKPLNKLCGKSPLMQDSQNNPEPASSYTQVYIYLSRALGAHLVGGQERQLSQMAWAPREKMLLFFKGGRSAHAGGPKGVPKWTKVKRGGRKTGLRPVNVFSLMGPQLQM